MSDDRPCTCHPSEAPVPCQKKYAFSECENAALRAELTAERDALRANLRDELERADAWHKTFLQTQKHNDELRALLREAREYVADMPIVGDVLLDRIDAALKGDDRE